METSFAGSFGSGKPVIAILGEYDALFELSQKAGVAEKQPVEPGGCGHGCGHNGLGIGALAAAVAMKDYMSEKKLSGTVRYYGCPAEEMGGGKVYMVRDGIFEDADIALTWHPSDINTIHGSTLAFYSAYFKFNGISAHAGACPHLGRSALDAVELMNIGVNYLREHVVEQARMHYAITDAGGPSANVVQAHAEAVHVVRAPKAHQTREIFDRIAKIAHGAALMTETTVETVFDVGYSNYLPNGVLGELMHEKLSQLGPYEIDQADIDFARKLYATLTPSQKQTAAASVPDRAALSASEEKGIVHFIKPYSVYAMSCSTDVGDVSWVVPTASVMTATYALGTPGHSWQTVSQGKSALFHKGMLLAGKVIALTGIHILEHPELIEKAKAELLETLGGEAYICPVPPEARPLASR